MCRAVFHQQNWTPEFKVKIFCKVASRNKGWVMAYWFGFGGLAPFLVCKMFFAGFENDLCALKCAPSMREESKLSMGHLQSLLERGHLGLAETSWASESSSSSSLDIGQFPIFLLIRLSPSSSLSSSTSTLVLHRGVLDFSARALGVQLEYSSHLNCDIHRHSFLLISAFHSPLAE